MIFRVRPSLYSMLLVIGLAASAAGVYAQGSTNVQIRTLSNVGTTLTIMGSNFGTGAVTVQVGEGTAAVTSSSDTEIVAETAPLAPGTHIVKVIRDSNEGGSAHSTLRIR